MEYQQYSHRSSLSEIPDTLIHEGICLTDDSSCYSARHTNRRVCLRLLCFALQVLVKTHKPALTHTLTAAGTDVAILGCVDTESRLAAEHVCVCVS